MNAMIAAGALAATIAFLDLFVMGVALVLRLFGSVAR